MLIAIRSIFSGTIYSTWIFSSLFFTKAIFGHKPFTCLWIY